MASPRQAFADLFVKTRACQAGGPGEPVATTASGGVAIGPDRVDLWQIDLDRPLAGDRALAPDEREKAERFAFAKHRHRFQVGRIALRTILSGYLGIAPGEVVFGYGEQGKPRLVGTGGDLHFNLSHSGTTGMVAVSDCHSVGIDIEQLGRADPSIADHAFSPQENAVLATLDGAARDLAFYACWTRKEALLKAVGLGLSYPTQSFTVGLDAARVGRVLECQAELMPADDWRFLPIGSVPGILGAVAVRAPARLRYRRSMAG